MYKKQQIVLKKRFVNINGDHITLLNVFHAWKQNNESDEWCWNNFLNGRSLRAADTARNQLVRISHRRKLELCRGDFGCSIYLNNIRKAILTGYFMQVAYLQRTGEYFTAKEHQLVFIHPSVCLSHKPTWNFYHELVLTSKNYIRIVTDIEGEWLLEIAPHYFDPNSFPAGQAKESLRQLYKKVDGDKLP